LVVPSLDGSRTAVAQAAVLTRAAAALDQPNAILYIQEQNYGTVGSCFALARSSSAGAPGTPICVGGRSTDAGTSGISADPANDTLNYSSQEWLSPDESQVHTIYGNGDEAALNNSTGQYTIYDAANDTLINDSSIPITPPPIGTIAPLAIGPLALSRAISDPAYFEELYQEAQAGDKNAQGQTTFTSELVGQTTIDGESVYELRFDFHFTAPADIAADNAPDQENLLYLDSKTYTPVRSVKMAVNPSGQPDGPSGTTVLAVTDFTVQSLPDNPANERLLQMSPHPGATQIQENHTPQTGTTASGTGTGAALGTGATGPSGATGASSEAGPTGSSGASASGSSGVTRTAPTN
jgi:hypothetical protein